MVECFVQALIEFRWVVTFTNFIYIYRALDDLRNGTDKKNAPPSGVSECLGSVKGGAKPFQTSHGPHPQVNEQRSYNGQG